MLLYPKDPGPVRSFNETDGVTPDGDNTLEDLLTSQAYAYKTQAITSVTVPASTESTALSNGSDAFISIESLTTSVMSADNTDNRYYQVTQTYPEVLETPLVKDIKPFAINSNAEATTNAFNLAKDIKPFTISIDAEISASISNEAKDVLTQVIIPLTYRLQLLHYSDSEAGFLAPQTAPYLAALVDGFDNTYLNTLILAGGDNYIASPFLNGGTDLTVRDELNTVTGSSISMAASTNHPIAAVDIGIHSVIGVDASTIGNHEFDLGARIFRDAFTPGSVSGWVGAQFPYL